MSNFLFMTYLCVRRNDRVNEMNVLTKITSLMTITYVNMCIKYQLRICLKYCNRCLLKCAPIECSSFLSLELIAHVTHPRRIVKPPKQRITKKRDSCTHISDSKFVHMDKIANRSMRHEYSTWDIADLLSNVPVS